MSLAFFHSFKYGQHNSLIEALRLETCLQGYFENTWHIETLLPIIPKQMTNQNAV